MVREGSEEEDGVQCFSRPDCWCAFAVINIAATVLPIRLLVIIACCPPPWPHVTPYMHGSVIHTTSRPWQIPAVVPYPHVTPCDPPGAPTSIRRAARSRPEVQRPASARDGGPPRSVRAVLLFVVPLGLHNGEKTQWGGVITQPPTIMDLNKEMMLRQWQKQERNLGRRWKVGGQVR